MKCVQLPIKIIKRDGHIEDFEQGKITAAILRAGTVTGDFEEITAQRLSDQVVKLVGQTYSNRFPTVEDIQDIVEQILLHSPFKKTAKSYILYRHQHAEIREITTHFNVQMVDQYLHKKDWQVNENSNMSFSLQGLNHYLSSEISKTYWLNKIYPAEVGDAHRAGDFHIHDLGILSVYCVGWDLQDLLMQGFKGASGKVESGPPKHFRAALGQIVNFFYTLQGEAAGAQAFSNFDTLLAPFIRFDGLGYKEVKQGLQEFIFNMNIPTRVGFQTPFTNITLDVTIPSYYANEPVIIGGERRETCYKDFQPEMDMFNKAFWEVMLEGDAKGRVFTFPIPTYNITKDFDWDNPNFSLLWELTAKYGVAYFANFINSDMRPEDMRSMCCRLRIDNRQLRKKGGGLFGASPLTGSIGVVTINMPRLGYLAQDEDDFFKRLDLLMNLAKESLEVKRKVIEKLMDENLYPYMKFYLRDIKHHFGQYWVNHFSAIGLVGMNEACLNFLKNDIASHPGHSFTIKVLDFMRQKLVRYQEETGHNYNLEATPAEGVCYRMAQLDKKVYSDIICANEAEYRKGHEPFYTNSTHLPVNYSDDIFEVLQLQDPLQTRYTGGTVLHLFVGEKIHHAQGLRSLIKTVAKNFHLPYFTVTPTFSVCPACGYMAGEHDTCLKCRSECEVYSRVVGYLRPVRQWNKGKKEEFQTRKMYQVERLLKQYNPTITEL